MQWLRLRREATKGHESELCAPRKAGPDAARMNREVKKLFFAVPSMAGTPQARALSQASTRDRTNANWLATASGDELSSPASIPGNPQLC